MRQEEKATLALYLIGVELVTSLPRGVLTAYQSETGTNGINTYHFFAKLLLKTCF